jgi:hypothetical protein
MVKGGIGLTEKSNPSLPILGYSDTETVKLDFDDASFKFVRNWALKAVEWFKLEGFLILKSSKNHYHVVLNKTVAWKRNLHVVAWVALQSKNKGLTKWLLMQCIKEKSTLRISSKKEKPIPRIVHHEGKQDQQIDEYLKMRNLIKKIEKTRNMRESKKIARTLYAYN